MFLSMLDTPTMISFGVPLAIVLGSIEAAKLAISKLPGRNGESGGLPRWRQAELLTKIVEVQEQQTQILLCLKDLVSTFLREGCPHAKTLSETLKTMSKGGRP